MLKPSEVLMRAHNEGRACGMMYAIPVESMWGSETLGRDWRQLCALGFLIEPFKAEFNLERRLPAAFVAMKYDVPLEISREIESRYEGWNGYEGNQQPLNVIAEWLEGIGY